MLRTTLRQLVSISGRTILAIGLTSATVLALAPSAKAGLPTSVDGSVTVNNPEKMTLGVSQAGLASSWTVSNVTQTGGTEIATITAQNNSGNVWYVKASSFNDGDLLNGTTSSITKVAYKILTSKIGGTATGNTISATAMSGSKTTALPIYTSATDEVAEVTFKVNIETGLFSAVKIGDYTDTITFSMTSSL